MACDSMSFSTIFQSYWMIECGGGDNNEKLCAMECCLRLNRSTPYAGLDG